MLDCRSYGVHVVSIYADALPQCAAAALFTLFTLLAYLNYTLQTPCTH